MESITVVVLADPAAAPLQRLKAVGPEFQLTIGKTADSVAEALPHTRILFNWTGGATEMRRVMEGAPKLEWIHTIYAGLERSLFPELVASPVLLTNGSGVFSQSLAEFVVLGMLYFAKDVPRMTRASKRREWDVYDKVEIRRQTLGIVGHGDIGRAIASRARGLGMTVLALRRDSSPRPGDENVDRVYRSDELSAMLPQCDYVAIATPQTPQTAGMIGPREFDLMKRQAVVLNVGRGTVIQERALIDALQSGRIRGAVLDVFEEEPLPQQSPLWTLDNVLISAHSADHVEHWLEDGMDFFVAQLARWREGEPLSNVVDKQAGY